MKVFADVPNDLDAVFIYNGSKFYASKLKFALASKKFYEFPNLLSSNEFVFSGKQPINLFEEFIMHAGEMEFCSENSSVNFINTTNVFNYLELAEEWKTNKIIKICEDYLKSQAFPISSLIQSYKQSPTQFLENIIAFRFDECITSQNLIQFNNLPLNHILNLVHNKNIRINNYDSYCNFIRSQLQLNDSKAFPLFSFIDFKIVSYDEISSLLASTSLSTVYKHNEKYNGQNEIDIQSIYERINARIDSLTQIQNDMKEKSNLFEVIKKEPDQLLEQQGFSKSLEETFVHFDKNSRTELKRTNSTVNGLTKKVLVLESSIKQEQEETKRLLSQIKSLKKCFSVLHLVSIDEEKKEDPPIEVPFSYSGEKFKGILSQLATAYEVAKLDPSIVTVNASSISHGDPQKITEFQNIDFFQSEDKNNSWIQFDFISNTISITSYSIQTISDDVNGPHLKGWNLEGSNDTQTWTLIDSRKNDSKLNGSNFSAHFISNGSNDQHFRFIRLIQTEANHTGNFRLSISNMEFFGSIIVLS